MKVAVEKTGGLVVLAESFGHSVFKDSFKRVFEEGEQSLGLCFKWVHRYETFEVYLSSSIAFAPISSWSLLCGSCILSVSLVPIVLSYKNVPYC